MATKEVWRPIPGYEGSYEVSDRGRVRSLDRKVPQVSRWGEPMWRRLRGQILKPEPYPRGYQRVHLGTRGKWFVHQLVMLAFVGPCPDGLEVCHGHGNASDNRLINLRYDTHLENCQDTRRYGGMPRGEKHHAAKLTKHDVLAIRSSSEPAMVLAERYGLAWRYIWEIRTRKTWAWVTEDVEDTNQAGDSNGVGQGTR